MRTQEWDKITLDCWSCLAKWANPLWPNYTLANIQLMLCQPEWCGLRCLIISGTSSPNMSRNGAVKQIDVIVLNAHWWLKLAASVSWTVINTSMLTGATRSCRSRRYELMDNACDEASNRNSEYWVQTKLSKSHNSTSPNSPHTCIETTSN